MKAISHPRPCITVALPRLTGFYSTDAITITHILQQLIALFDLLTFTDLKLTAHPFPCLCAWEARRDGLSDDVMLYPPSSLLHKPHSLQHSAQEPLISFIHWLFFFMNDHRVLLSLSNTSSHCPCRGSLSSAVCRGLCVLAVELADGRRIPNQPQLPHRSANEPEQLIGHSAGVPATRIITFLPRSGLV